ncbi:MAG: PadR family transcriptional regulator [Promethearchaeota archaeon]
MNALAKFKKGAIMVHILYHASKEPFYGVWLKRELKRHGYNISYGTLYPWLNKLSAAGYLQFYEKNVNGKIRKYYTITDLGKKQLLEMKKYLKELHDEVIE